MTRHRFWFAALALVTASSVAFAESAEEAAPTELPRLGFDPGEPVTRSAPPSVPFGVAPLASSDNVLDFHGFILVPLNVGVHEREEVLPGQGATVLHNPPLIPQNYRSFEYTAVVPQTWVQLNFSYGNRTLSGTVVMAARNLTDASGLLNPAEQLGATDAFLRVNLTDPVGTPLEFKVGAATGRYGVMGAYDLGRYATPLIARTNAIGEIGTVAFDLSPLTLVIEQGFGGQLGRPEDIVPAGWNDFAFVGVGASFVHHWHAGLAYQDLAQLGLHYFGAFTRDDSATTAAVPDGTINVAGADVRLTAGRFGHLYLGAARTTASNSSTVSGIIEVLNARGGPELMEQYFGPNSGGNGALTTFGWQYDLSLARLIYDDLYKGRSPDVTLSLFGVTTSVESDDPEYDDTAKIKTGAEITYNMLSWFGVSTRLDHVALDLDNARKSFNVISPRLLFHTDWQSQAEFALQYSHFIYGGEIVPRTGFPPRPDPTANPDRDVLSLSASFWW